MAITVPAAYPWDNAVPAARGAGSPGCSGSPARGRLDGVAEQSASRVTEDMVTPRIQSTVDRGQPGIPG